MLRIRQPVPSQCFCYGASVHSERGAYGWAVVPLGQPKPENAPTGHGSGISRDATRILETGPGFFSAMRISLLAVVYGASRITESLLYGIKADDLIAVGAAVAAVLGVVMAAGYAPARRASRIDPVIALRHE
jgi:hypothetical protein